MKRRLLALLLAAAAAGCAGRPSRKEPAAPAGPIVQDCAPRFVPKGEWYGGDGAYSIPVSPERSIWLFGDSFAGEVPHLKTRAGTTLLSGTTAADSRCLRGGTFSIRYHFERDPSGKPAMLFRPQEPGQNDPALPGYRYYWPLDGFLHEGKLFLALAEIEKKDPAAAAAMMNFKVAGTVLAEVANFSESIGDWKIAYRRLSRGDLVTPGGAIVLDGGFAYLYAYFNDVPGKAPRGLARFPLAALAAGGAGPGPALEFLASDGSWKPGLPAARAEARIVMADDATEMTVRRLPGSGKWAAVYNYAEGFGTATPANRLTPGDRVVYRLADSPTGPWSEPKTLFKIDAKALTRGRYDPSVFCYAAKLHPQYLRRGRVPATYICNSTDFFGTLIKNLPVYVPQVRWVPLTDFR